VAQHGGASRALGPRPRGGEMLDIPAGSGPKRGRTKSGRAKKKPGPKRGRRKKAKGFLAWLWKL